MQSPTWSPISPLAPQPASTSGTGSKSNQNLLSSILLDTGIYSPRHNAEAPIPKTMWERETASTSASFRLPENISITPEKESKIRDMTTKRAPRKSAGATSKAAHLLWVEEQGLPNLKSKLQSQKQDLEKAAQEIK